MAGDDDRPVGIDRHARHGATLDVSEIAGGRGSQRGRAGPALIETADHGVSVLKAGDVDGRAADGQASGAIGPPGAELGNVAGRHHPLGLVRAIVQGHADGVEGLQEGVRAAQRAGPPQRPRGLAGDIDHAVWSERDRIGLDVAAGGRAGLLGPLLLALGVEHAHKSVRAVGGRIGRRRGRSGRVEVARGGAGHCNLRAVLRDRQGVAGGARGGAEGPGKDDVSRGVVLGQGDILRALDPLPVNLAGDVRDRVDRSIRTRRQRARRRGVRQRLLEHLAAGRRCGQRRG